MKRILLPAILLAIAANPLRATTYDEWKESYFGLNADPLVAGFEGDPDQDLSTNLAEFLLGTDPWVGQADAILAPEFSIDASTNLPHLSARFRIHAQPQGVLFVPQVTEEFGTRWRADQAELRLLGFTNDNRLEYLSIDRQSADLPSHRFLRLLIAVDADEDGLPDDWELALGLNAGDPFDAMTDSDGDGDSNLEEFLHGTDANDIADNSRRDDPPRAPRLVEIINNSDGTRDVIWDDVSDNEDFFVIYGTDGNGNQIELGRVGPNSKRFRLPIGY